MLFASQPYLGAQPFINIIIHIPDHATTGWGGVFVTAMFLRTFKLLKHKAGAVANQMHNGPSTCNSRH